MVGDNPIGLTGPGAGNCGRTARTADDVDTELPAVVKAPGKIRVNVVGRTIPVALFDNSPDVARMFKDAEERAREFVVAGSDDDTKVGTMADAFIVNR